VVLLRVTGEEQSVFAFLRTKLIGLDKDKLDFRVTVSGTSLFRSQSRFAPSNKLPSRESGEHHAWISVSEDMLEKPLAMLKRMVLARIDRKPGIIKVSTALCEI
jgi:hypothetical protein